jgi:hypothetical protein
MLIDGNLAEAKDDTGSTAQNLHALQFEQAEPDVRRTRARRRRLYATVACRFFPDTSEPSKTYPSSSIVV